MVKEKLETSVTSKAVEGFFRQTSKYYRMCGLDLPFSGKPLEPEFLNDEQQSTQPTITYEVQT